MNDLEQKTPEKKPEIAKFLLKDTLSLRNEVKYTELADMVHPLTFSYSKKHSEMSLVPIIDKFQDEELKELFYKVLE